MPYVLTILGLLIMCVPDDAGVLRTVIQSVGGLGVFGLGILILSQKNG